MGRVQSQAARLLASRAGSQQPLQMVVSFCIFCISCFCIGVSSPAADLPAPTVPPEGAGEDGVGEEGEFEVGADDEDPAL